MAEVKEIVVGWRKGGEYKTVKSPHTLNSGGAGPCLVIGAVYKTKCYMSHIPPGSQLDYSKVMNPLFEELQRDVQEKRNLQIYLVGANVDRNPQVQIGKDMVLEIIAQQGFEDCVEAVRWNFGEHSKELHLILLERKAVIYDFDNLDILRANMSTEEFPFSQI